MHFTLSTNYNYCSSYGLCLSFAYQLIQIIYITQCSNICTFVLLSHFCDLEVIDIYWVAPSHIQNVGYPFTLHSSYYSSSSWSMHFGYVAYDSSAINDPLIPQALRSFPTTNYLPIFTPQAYFNTSNSFLFILSLIEETCPLVEGPFTWIMPQLVCVLIKLSSASGCHFS